MFDRPNGKMQISRIPIAAKCGRRQRNILKFFSGSAIFRVARVAAFRCPPHFPRIARFLPPWAYADLIWEFKSRNRRKYDVIEKTYFAGQVFNITNIHQICLVSNNLSYTKVKSPSKSIKLLLSLGFIILSFNVIPANAAQKSIVWMWIYVLK